MTKEDFHIDLNADNQLVISSEKRTENSQPAENESKKEKGHYLRREFSYSSFRQSFSLPETIERDRISAKMENGVLKIEIPKKSQTAAEAKAKCIEIE